MIEHRQTLINIKSDLLSICISALEKQDSYYEYSLLLHKCLHQHFDIDQCFFLLYEGETLKPFNINSTNEINEIPWENFESWFGQQKWVEVPDDLLMTSEFKQLTHMILLKVGHFDIHGVLLVKSTPKWSAFTQSEYFEDFVDVVSKTLSMISKNVVVRHNEKQYRKLYTMSDLFHSTMDIDLILENVLITIQENFPNFNVELILSNDQDRQTKIPIKQFDYLSERPSAIEAFVSGKIITEDADDLNCTLLNAPIKGRQAIYGILQVSAPYSYLFTSTQKEFIRMLAHASGNALENAKLYHQSHRLISDLQLINETSHRLNMRLDINEMFMFLQKQLMKSFQPMELCFVLKENDEYKLTEASTDLFQMDEGAIYINHVGNHFNKSHDPLFIADFSRLISKDVRYKSVMAIPMIVEQRINGFSIVLHRDSYFFSFDSFKLMQSLIHHSSLAIANSILRNQLQEMVDHDHLTKLYARNYLDKFVEQSLQNDDSGMFLLIDIDNFKRINDTYGHQIGDTILVQIGELLMNIIDDRGISARWGGEEMAVYVTNIHENEALQLSQQIVDSIPKATDPSVTISAGLVFWNKKAPAEYQKIFLQADTALYVAKNNGKNQVCLYDDSMLLQS
ncbi:sensor domain-containing diguanylate cyclase [Lysinibacillus endophyticus]|uniref:GGDEF domain-containing protein n=1 Tax=Ureibacillus endophyticus TaxID=1978490 RepID=A0A494ZB49_9BACL|nr:GGDEF domain-containing protein [Lysinibacillus endophyticus]MCP1145583.1 GGDEF domain-containing protein [Lysinibacillus endophyticus]RKQ20028.1 GGDEF domain-containing protein [Lysinibacillus endophyticus]